MLGVTPLGTCEKVKNAERKISALWWFAQANVQVYFNINILVLILDGINGLLIAYS